MLGWSLPVFSIITKESYAMRTKIFLVLILLGLTGLTDLTAEARPGRGRVQEATITLTAKGYEPETIRLRRGVPTRLTFIRKFEATCATEVIIEGYDIRRELPLNQPVVIEFTPSRAGVIEYSCSMKMVGGTISIR